MLVRILIGLCLLFLVATRAAAVSGEAVILVLGDSLSAAHGMQLEESWVTLLQRRLDENGQPYRVINSSVSGDTSLTALNRLRSSIDRYDPALCLVELGGNDGLQGLPPAQLHDNLTAILDLCSRHARHSLLLEIRLPPNYGPQYLARFREVYAHLGERQDTTLVPFFLESVFDQPGMMQADGIHPTARAQPLLAAIVLEQLRPWLR